MGKMSRDKGARGEREVIDMLQPIVDKAYEDAYPDVSQITLRQITPQLKRTSSMQADGGGCDVCGLPWLALEVKRCETLQLDAWWQQCLQQAKPSQMPVLMYRQSKHRWRVRCWLQIAVASTAVVADLSMADFCKYFADCLRLFLQRKEK
jgi:hypothetical protein